MHRQPTDPRVMSTIQKLEAKIEQLENEAKLSKTSQVEQQQQAYQAAIKQIGRDAQDLVNSDPEFETIKALGQTKEVVKLIERTYAKDGIVLSVEEAAKEVEAELVERSLKAAELRKVKERQAALNRSKNNAETKPQGTQQQQMKTLTNANSSTRPLTARERAIAAMEGRLKS